MPTRISTAAATAAADAVAALVDGGSAAGKIRVYSGPQPSNSAAAPTGTLLAEFTLSDPAFNPAVDGVAHLGVTPALQVNGLADGQAGWFRVLDSGQAAAGGQGIFDGTVSVTGGGGQLQLNTVTISVGVAVTITAGTITMPQA